MTYFWYEQTIVQKNTSKAWDWCIRTHTVVSNLAAVKIFECPIHKVRLYSWKGFLSWIMSYSTPEGLKHLTELAVLNETNPIKCHCFGQVCGSYLQTSIQAETGLLQVGGQPELQKPVLYRDSSHANSKLPVFSEESHLIFSKPYLYR